MEKFKELIKCLEEYNGPRPALLFMTYVNAFEIFGNIHPRKVNGMKLVLVDELEKDTFLLMGEDDYIKSQGITQKPIFH